MKSFKNLSFLLLMVLPNLSFGSQEQAFPERSWSKHFQLADEDPTGPFELTAISPNPTAYVAMTDQGHPSLSGWQTFTNFVHRKRREIAISTAEIALVIGIQNSGALFNAIASQIGLSSSTLYAAQFSTKLHAAKTIFGYFKKSLGKLNKKKKVLTLLCTLGASIALIQADSALQRCGTEYCFNSGMGELSALFNVMFGYNIVEGARDTRSSAYLLNSSSRKNNQE